MPSATAFLTSVRTILNERAEAIERDASEAERLLRRYQGAVIEYRADLDALILRARLAGQLTAFTEDIAAIEERLATQAAEVALAVPAVEALRGATDAAAAAIAAEVAPIDTVLADGTPPPAVLAAATALQARVPLAALDLSGVEELDAAATAALRLAVLARNRALSALRDLERAL